MGHGLEVSENPRTVPMMHHNDIPEAIYTDVTKQTVDIDIATPSNGSIFTYHIVDW